MKMCDEMCDELLRIFLISNENTRSCLFQLNFFGGAVKPQFFRLRVKAEKPLL